MFVAEIIDSKGGKLIEVFAMSLWKARDKLTACFPNAKIVWVKPYHKKEWIGIEFEELEN